MAITQKSIKILWSAAAGHCAFDGCNEKLCFHEAGEHAPFTIGEMAHICGDKPAANRHEPSQSAQQRDDYANLILLCPTHHSLVDEPENEALYPASVLTEMKARHEARISGLLEQPKIDTKQRLALAILPLVEENRQSWQQYGPLSELARREPHNEAAHAVWMSERLSVIVPNNRKILAMLEANAAFFASSEMGALMAMRLHLRSYERWVRDDIPYSAVRRFPAEFDALIRGIADGSS